MKMILQNINICVLVLIFVTALPTGLGESFFSKLTNRGKNNGNKNGGSKGNDYVSVCETVRVMPRLALAVVGGSPLKVEDSAPYIAAVGERTSNGSISWFCGGSLISPQHVLTAAHCLISRNVSTIRVGSFSTKVRSTENDYEILDIIIHPDYKITESYHDIGVIKTKNPVTFDNNIKPICLPQTNEKYDKEKAKVIGWGAEEFGGEGTHKLQHVEVEVFTNANCEKAYRNSTIAPKTFPKGIKNEQLCAGSKKGGKDACQGDSGGPLVLTDEQGIVRQIGIVSTGAGCGFKMYPGVYTRVSSYTNWIKDQMKSTSSSQLPQQKEQSNRDSTTTQRYTNEKESYTTSRPQTTHQALQEDKQNKPHNSPNFNSNSKKHNQNSKETFENNYGNNRLPSVTDNGNSQKHSQNSKQPFPQNDQNNNNFFGSNSIVNSNNRKTTQSSREVLSTEKEHQGDRREPHQTSSQHHTSSFSRDNTQSNPHLSLNTNYNSQQHSQNSRETYTGSEISFKDNLQSNNNKFSNENTFSLSSNDRRQGFSSREILNENKRYSDKKVESNIEFVNSQSNYRNRR